jgi:hypothetical protein
MEISKVKTAIKFGDFVLKKNHKNKIDIKYLSNISKKDLTDDSPRVYIFVIDRIIKKIGGSADKGGIKATIGFYTSSMTGSPGRPRFIVHLLIERALKSGSKAELYVITAPKVLAIIKGLFGSKKVKIASYKEMENYCESDYYSIEKKYPDWNFQENHEPYPKDLDKKFNRYHENRLR